MIERAYSVPISSGVARNGGIIGYLLSGCYGTVYAISSSSYGPNVVGATNNRAVKILGEARKVTEAEMKGEVVLEKLGSAFTASNAYDTENKGIRNWHGRVLPSELLDRMDAASVGTERLAHGEQPQENMERIMSRSNLWSKHTKRNCQR